MPRTELACARALLDALEALLDAEHEEESTQCDVVVQVADQLARAATIMKQWTEERSREESSMPRPYVRALEVARRSPGAETERKKDASDTIQAIEARGIVREPMQATPLASFADRGGVCVES
jgi:hypothetical protein